MKTHPVSVSHLVVGLVFLGIATTWALEHAGVIDADGMRWVGPVILIIAGGAGLVASVAKSLSRSRPAVRTSAEEADAEDTTTLFD
jgi:hypothetical protein